MNIDTIVKQLPQLAAVMDKTWLHRHRHWAEDFIGPRLPWYRQLESDLASLQPKVSRQKLIACYQKSLRNEPEIQKTIYEIHGAAFLAKVATGVRLHVPRKGDTGPNFDIQAEIQGCSVNAECKTRKDEFPFNVPPDSEDPRGVTHHAAVRATMDPHDAAELAMQTGPTAPGLHYIDTPASTVIRQILLEGLGQLPERGCNLVIFGHIEGFRHDLEDALWGTPFVGGRRNPETGKSTFVQDRAPTGAFSPGPAGQPFQSLSGVLWVCLWRGVGVLGRAYKLYTNPNARVPLPTDVIEAIDALTEQWATPTQTQGATSEK